MMSVSRRLKGLRGHPIFDYLKKIIEKLIHKYQIIGKFNFANRIFY